MHANSFPESYMTPCNFLCRGIQTHNITYGYKSMKWPFGKQGCKADYYFPRKKELVQMSFQLGGKSCTDFAKSFAVNTEK